MDDPSAERGAASLHYASGRSRKGRRRSARRRDLKKKAEVGLEARRDRSRCHLLAALVLPQAPPSSGLKEPFASSL